MFDNTFGLSRGTYAMAYCTYTASTIAFQDIIDGLSDARERLDTFIRALNIIRESYPGVKRSTDIIEKCLDSSKALSLPQKRRREFPLTAPIASTSTQSNPEELLLNPMEAPPMIDQTPAIPYRDTANYFTSMDVDFVAFSTSFSYLNSYPQEWFNLTEDL